jgi:surface protein
MISQQIYLKKMSYVSEFVALYEIIPYIRNFPLNNKTIRVAVKDYLEGGERKADIITKYGKICDWNTTNVTNMSRLFKDLNYFNQPIGKWDTSKVTDMYGMFLCCESFDQPIGEWDVSKVTYMNSMFYGAKNFNQDISKWDTSKVTTMNGMFKGAKSFNQTISKWDTSKVLKIILCINYESYNDRDSDEYDSDDE